MGIRLAQIVSLNDYLASRGLFEPKKTRYKKEKLSKKKKYRTKSIFNMIWR
jgi:hypothetical protein